MTASILRILNDENPFKLSTNVSNFATGTVLSQLDLIDGLFHSVAFYLKSLNMYEYNYEIYNKELLTILQALKKYRHYLEEHPIFFEI